LSLAPFPFPFPFSASSFLFFSFLFRLRGWGGDHVDVLRDRPILWWRETV